MRPWALFALSFLLLAWSADRQRDRAQTHYLATQSYEDVYYLPPPDYLVLGSLGYREALANLIWSKALVYFGTELRHRGAFANVYRYTDAMLALDPYFKRVYRWIATAAIYRTGHVSEQDVYRAIEYLKAGFRLFPDDGELAWDLGATYTYELAPMLKGEARQAAKRDGLEYLELAAVRGAGPAWLVLGTASQLDKLGKTERAIKHLEDVYATTTDSAVKADIEARLARLRTQAYAEALKRTNEALEAGRTRDFPYLDPSLYLLVGPRPPFDGHGLRMRGFDPLTRPPALPADVGD